MVASWRERWRDRRWIKAAGLVLALISAVLLAYGGTWRAAWGQESPLATPPPVFVPVTLPSISGEIRNVDGAPLSGLVVTAYRLQQVDWIFARQTTTNALGEYRFPWLPAGYYRLQVRDPKGLYAFTYYPDAVDIEAAADIAVTGTSIEALDMELTAGGQITGTFTWSDGPEPFDSTISLFHDTAAPIATRLTSSDNLALAPEIRQYRLVERKSFTETRVLYDFTGLAAGRYRVCAEAVALHNDLHECFEDAALGIYATDVVVATGQKVTGVSIDLGDGADFATLIGTLTLPDGTPAQGVDVEVMPMPNVDFSAAPQPEQTETDSEGTFRLEALPSGRYTIQFTDPEGGYLTTAYRATEDAVEPTVITLEPSDVVTFTSVIQAAGQITGTVTIDGANAGMNGQVSAYYLSEEGWAIAGTGTLVAATGVYTVGGLPGANYRLQYQVDLPAQIFYGGVTLEGATDIPVITGTLVGGIDLDLTPYIAGLPYGSISGVVLVDGRPQPNMQVEVYAAGFDCCVAPPPLVVTTTDSEGRYTINGLAPGQYKVGVRDPALLYATVYAPDQRTFETAAVFVIGNPADGVARQSITDMSSTMGAGGAVSRTVLRPDDSPVAGATVRLYQRVGAPGEFPFVASTVTDSEGVYTFGGLVPDTYQVCITITGMTETTCGGRGGTGLGFDVVVTAGQQATGLDIIDVPAPLIP